MIEEIESIKEEIKQLRIKGEELHNKLIEIAYNNEKTIEEDKYKLPEPKDYQTYLTINTGFHTGINDYCYTTQFDINNYKRFNYFLNKEDVERRSKQVENYFKVLHYLEAVNGDWKPDWNDGKEIKYTINYTEDIGVCYNEIISYFRSLSFKSEEARDNFRKFISDEEIKIFLNPLGVI